MKKRTSSQNAAPIIFAAGTPHSASRRVPILVICAAIFSAGVTRAEEKARLWTNANGTTATATLESVVGEKVNLRMGNGVAAQTVVAALSPGDQTHIREWIERREKAVREVSESTGSGGGDTSDAPRVEKEWPKTMRLADSSKDGAEVIVEDDANREYRYRSEHYEFECDSRLSANVVREFSALFEATYQLNCILPLDLKPRPERLRKRFLAKIFTTREDYMKNGGMPGSAGVYTSAQKALLVPLASLGVKMVGKRVSVDYGSREYGTLIHEITHQMMNEWLGRIPTWYAEGSAEWVELAEYKRGRFSFAKHDAALRTRLSRYGATFPMVPLENLMKMGSREWAGAVAGGGASLNYASALALTYYFYHIDGKGDGSHMIAYLRAIENVERPSREKLDAAIDEHLLRGRSYAELSEDFTKGMRRIRVKVDLD